MKKKLPTLLIVVVIAAVVVAGVWLLRSRWTAEEKPGTGRSKSAAVTSEQVETIVGRWRRPDGGYIIDIRGLDAAGDLEVAYYNPRPINVSLAQVVESPDGLHIFIELRDTGYPGATYRLDYDSDKDMLTGVYHQPSVNQSFDVIFVRAQ
jgi:hypothetical protein